MTRIHGNWLDCIETGAAIETIRCRRKKLRLVAVAAAPAA